MEGQSIPQLPIDPGDLIFAPRILAERAINQKVPLYIGFIGQPVSDLIEYATDSFVQRYEYGSMYWKRETKALCVYGGIYQHYQSLGSEGSWLGYPVTDETDFSENGRISVFERGAIYWWPDTGAIELNDLVVNYTGLVCFGETTELSSADEPYVAMGIITPAGTLELRSQIYEDVDAGESRPDLIEIYRGKPCGLTVSVLLMEHDLGDPNKYKEVVGAAVRTAAPGLVSLIKVIPVIGPILAPVAGPIYDAISPKITEILNETLGTGDDKIGETTLIITAKQMVVLAGRTRNSEERGVSFKLATPLLSDGDGSYKLYFGLDRT
ncbi:MAG: hypothetical protein KME52_00135 [Desmonostoc geniculatum HA4340-LM1]|jgi:hypothetical protein|nr:hypothetical protein [Desmonostoc geniculatum HA4340-LM1]